MSAAPARPLPPPNPGSNKSPQTDVYRAQRFLANMQRDRQTAANDNARADNDNAEPFGAAPGDPVLLELPTRSYARPIPTGEEREAARQRTMARTAENLFPGQRPTGEEVQPTRPASAPGRERPGLEEQPEELERQVPEEEEMEERERMAQLEAARMEEVQMMLAAESAQQAANDNAIAQGADRVRRLARFSKMVRRAIKAIQAALAESFLPLITLPIQLYAEVINKWILKKRIPWLMEPDPNPQIDETEPAVALITCCGCVVVLVVVALFAIIAWAFENPVEAVLRGFGAIL